MQENLESNIEQISKKLEPIELVRALKSGKEATVYLVKSQSQFYALKIYKENISMATQNDYTLGKHLREKSLRRAVAKKNKVGRELTRKLWTKREFYLLDKFHSLGACVPKVYTHTNDAILMEYLGDPAMPAPRLIDVKLSESDMQRAYLAISSSINVFLDNGVVHGDLSAYNVLWWDRKPYIIDFPQAIDVKRNPNWEVALQRDLKNVATFFNVSVL